MEVTQQYKGKPTVYLDQNILDVFTKHGLGETGKRLQNEYQVVYSDETLKEIKRSKGFEDKFLNVLKQLNASHIKLVLEQPGFVITDNATIKNRDPFEAFDEYCLNASDGVDIEYAMQQWLFKFSGGRKGDSLEEIHNEQLSVFSELMASITDNSDELPEVLRKQLASYTEAMTSQFEATLKETEKLMVKDIPDDRNWDGIKDFRKHVEIGPKQLNNIVAPNVLEQIWDKFKNISPYDKCTTDINDFFHLKKNPIYPEQPYYKHQKVTGIYNMLNTLGYYPDSKVHKERRFTAAMSDNSHASIASFCDVLLSNDESFIKKVQAAYEYLKIPTLATLVVINYAK